MKGWEAFPCETSVTDGGDRGRMGQERTAYVGSSWHNENKAWDLAFAAYMAAAYKATSSSSARTRTRTSTSTRTRTRTSTRTRIRTPRRALARYVSHSPATEQGQLWIIVRLASAWTTPPFGGTWGTHFSNSIRRSGRITTTNAWPSPPRGALFLPSGPRALK